jgi:hypothetical protein
LLHFNQSKHPPIRNYFSRREQWRLLLLVFALGGVIIAMRHLRRPEFATSVAQVFAEVPATQHTDTDSAHQPGHVAPAKPSAPVPADLRQNALDSVRDNTYFRTAEKNVWFRLIEILQELSADEMAVGSLGDVTYVQLVDQPGSYRAKLVTIRGTVRQVTKQTPAENELGLSSYYRLVIQPSDGTQWPIFVYCLELPAQFSSRTNPEESVSATGFFFKNLSYRWQDGLGIAPVILAKTVATSKPPVGGASPLGQSYVPVAADSWIDRDAGDNVPLSSAGPDLREVLSLAGWDAERLARFADDRPINDDERGELIELLWRIRSFDPASIDRWTTTGISVQDLVDDPPAHRGGLFRIIGRVVAIERHDLSEKDAARLESPAYYTCQIKLADGHGQVAVITPSVPKYWQWRQSSSSLNEPASASALFVKRIAAAQGSSTTTADTRTAMFVAKRVAWHPIGAGFPRVSLGKSSLGALGMDVGLFDDVQSRGSIRAVEREAFYQMLWAAGKIGANQLVRSAERNLDEFRAQWTEELSSAADDQHRALAREVIRRADEGRYSVAPLFNEPQLHIADLFVFDGVARRVVRVDTDSRPGGSGPSDVARRFGIRNYYEMQVFTDDSQNYPLVFCVRELPVGFPTGDDLRVPVRLAGFFFKDWQYTTRGTRSAETGQGSPAAAPVQFAPLLVGRAPFVLQFASSDNQKTQWILAGVFLLLLAGVAGMAWWFTRDDRRFGQRLRAARLSDNVGQSLQALSVPAESESMNNPGVLGSTGATSPD